MCADCMQILWRVGVLSVLMEIIGQKVIPAIANEKDFEKFLESKYTYCVIMNMNISQLGILIDMAHKQKKKALVHIDLIHGLANDEYGCEYTCQRLRADGVISTKGKVVEMAKRNKKIAILRLFLIDSKSLDKGLSLCNTVLPDYMEVLPGIADSIIPYIKSRVNVSIMSGGLIKTEEQIDACLNKGAIAVTVSDIKIAIKYLERDRG
ncbi:glycerol-3-phosphate responsive antiterminator [Lachnotalea glycerini]|uniref:Glycerol-3-phosphate responsive antiterminator n=2 Tax=Lachnotalea glycerini TaxID=1763509 RepID=A0A371JFG9_9FIRM|nr:glycerol-3-phosphate responsive antiterminator [Lachnotalea glycerini]